ncbi:hypothetical protein Mp_2g19440 [Marchantia polymorpha subsp. ruderalis]|uniref:Uncharacterized protein n=1 Tax=Marchantia polymorpha TaxID=3197 RepID=A0A2R6WVH5_MARPO|nr:hypothetical protein MARPO_0055s0108 [Marchantia polymorpha]BBN02935.1 hypothetical protein Mp_2g19440 [Marchantia polymorpha subsp. ruderalis]|eukprot:PTQ37857.1 hypothetical protein MARPO_0055s0108 [Marchantia polymorpha]
MTGRDGKRPDDREMTGSRELRGNFLNRFGHKANIQQTNWRRCFFKNGGFRSTNSPEIGGPSATSGGPGGVIDRSLVYHFISAARTPPSVVSIMQSTGRIALQDGMRAKRSNYDQKLPLACPSTGRVPRGAAFPGYRFLAWPAILVPSLRLKKKGSGGAIAVSCSELPPERTRFRAKRPPTRRALRSQQENMELLGVTDILLIKDLTAETTKLIADARNSFADALDADERLKGSEVDKTSQFLPSLGNAWLSFSHASKHTHGPPGLWIEDDNFSEPHCAPVREGQWTYSTLLRSAALPSPPFLFPRPSPLAKPRGLTILRASELAVIGLLDFPPQDKSQVRRFCSELKLAAWLSSAQLSSVQFSSAAA